MTRRGLGRGLDALLAGNGADADGGVRMVGVGEISPNPYQPRQNIEPDALDELSASIAAHGLIQPLVVRPVGGAYELIAGERRWRAAQAAGLEVVPVLVREADAQEMLALALIENVQRADLDPIEAAEAYQRLIDDFGLTQVLVAELVGKSRVAVANAVRLLQLAEPIRRLLREGALSEGHGRALLALQDAKARVVLAQRAAAEGWTVRRVEKEIRAAGELANDGAAAPKARSAGALDADTAAAVRNLEESLGTRVELRRKGPGGQLVLYYYSAEDLSALYDRLVAPE